MHFFLLPAFVFFAFFSSLYLLFFLFLLHFFFIQSDERIEKTTESESRYIWCIVSEDTLHLCESLQTSTQKRTDLSWLRFASSDTISFVCYPSFERVRVSATETDVDLIRNRNHLFRPLRSSTRDAFIRQGLINRYLRSLLQDSIKSIS